MRWGVVGVGRAGGGGRGRYLAPDDANGERIQVATHERVLQRTHFEQADAQRPDVRLEEHTQTFELIE